MSSSDPTWTDTRPDIWTIIEISAAILGACAITYRPLIKWIHKNWILKIQFLWSRPKRPSCRAGCTKSFVGNLKTGIGPSNRSETKIQPLGDSELSIPPMVYNPSRRFEGRDDFFRIDDLKFTTC